MKKILFIAGISILFLAGCSNFDKISQLEKQNQDLQAQSNNQQQINNLDLQAKCSDMASKYFISKGYKTSDGFDYKNHYNSKLNKCFILISTSSDNNNLFIDLYDAVEGKHYASYLGHFNCDPVVLSMTNDSKKCQLDSGNIWNDGNDTRSPADITVGFRGLMNGDSSGDENTKKQFMDAVQPFMND
ncbi:MAG: hypothetical protein NTZ97_00235 [Candidatus Moranbacteria bacterium]|nr:hypothetical protein [Candidatus Moranbacteria bacterium]